MKYFIALLVLLLLNACTASTPKSVDNLCSIFREKKGWYSDAADARDDWGSSIPIMMAMVYQESSFQAKARPPRKKILGFIPGFRPSSSYGYSQAKTTTWDDYKKSTRSWGADRDDFADAIDFVGWYNYQSYKRSKISRNDPYRLYLAYHEGHGGYNRGTYHKKQWLIKVARKVERKANTYQAQLHGCEKELKSNSGFFNWF